MDPFVESYRPDKSYEFSVVWTPIPWVAWLLPIIGHTGITTSKGVIRDFSGSYYVAEGHMAFGPPTIYWRLDVNRVKGYIAGYDAAVKEASLEYGGRMHIICWDDCHSHVVMALNLMEFEDSKSWNSYKIAYRIFRNGKYVSVYGWLKTWLPFLLFLLILFGVTFGSKFVHLIIMEPRPKMVPIPGEALIRNYQLIALSDKNFAIPKQVVSKVMATQK